jgi:peptidoglycan/LPS O-acetylase OafA/YrhL
MVFFVLSGFVISSMSAGKEDALRRYAINRAGRIYSVAVPAILLTLLCDRVGAYFNPELYRFMAEKYHLDAVSPARTIALALSFLTQSWGDVHVFSNIAYRSLSYEVWYYVLFGAIRFARGSGRGILIVAILAIMGPKISLYALIGFVGVLCRRLTAAYPVRKSAAGLIFAASAGCVVSICLPAVAEGINHLSAIRTLASCTFSIYLCHVPILILLYAVFPHDPRHPLLHLGYGLTAFVPIVLLARATEHRRDRLRRWLDAGWAFLGNRMKAVPGARSGS